MIDNSHEFSLLKHEIEERFGQRPRTPNDFRALSVAIREAVGQTLGVTTLKRLWGYISNSSRPTYSTLSILSRYAGHSDWDMFCRACSQDENSGFNTRRFTLAQDVKAGQKVTLKWGNDKSCQLIAEEEPRRFRVVEATNIKLLPGDLITVEAFVAGQPLIALQCVRDGVELGSYNSGRRSTISEITI